MNTGKVVFGVALVLFCLDASAKNIYKCGDTYQDLPCAGAAAGEVVGKIKPDAPLSPERKKQLEQEQKEMARDSRIFDAIANRQVVIGMTSNQLIRSWGNPDYINQSSSADQWVYERGGFKRQYVYVTGGIVTGWN